MHMHFMQIWTKYENMHEALKSNFNETNVGAIRIDLSSSIKNMQI